MITLQETNISQLGKRKIIFKYALSGGYVNSLEGNRPEIRPYFKRGVRVRYGRFVDQLTSGNSSRKSVGDEDDFVIPPWPEISWSSLRWKSPESKNRFANLHNNEKNDDT